MLVRLLYVSRSTKPLDTELLDSILSCAHQHNPSRGLTGILCYNNDTFVQILEGSRKEVSNLYNRIVRDPRHHDVELLHFEEIRERRFANWTMGKVNLSTINPSLLLRFSERPDFDPHNTPGSATMALLEDLIASAAIIGRH